MLITAALFLPWASYRALGPPSPDRSFQAEPPAAVALVAAAVVAILVVAARLFRPSRPHKQALTTAAALAVAVSLIEAGRRIAEANSHAVGPGGAETAFAAGSFVAVLGSLVMAAAAVGLLTEPTSCAAGEPWRPER